MEGTRLKKKKKLNEVLQVRLSTQEKNRIRGLADLYANGNISLWIVHAGLNAPREFLMPKDESFRRRRLKRP
jgi:hypothetical protein